MSNNNYTLRDLLDALAQQKQEQTPRPPLLGAGQTPTLGDLLNGLDADQLSVLESNLRVDPKGTLNQLLDLAGETRPENAYDPLLDNVPYQEEPATEILDQIGAGFKSYGGNLGAVKESINDRNYLRYKAKETLKDNEFRQKKYRESLTEDRIQSLNQFISSRRDDAIRVLSDPKNKAIYDYFTDEINNGSPEQAARRFGLLADAIDGKNGDDAEKLEMLRNELKEDSLIKTNRAYAEKTKEVKLRELDAERFESTLAPLRRQQSIGRLSTMSDAPSKIALRNLKINPAKLYPGLAKGGFIVKDAEGNEVHYLDTLEVDDNGNYKVGNSLIPQSVIDELKIMDYGYSDIQASVQKDTLGDITKDTNEWGDDNIQFLTFNPKLAELYEEARQNPNARAQFARVAGDFKQVKERQDKRDRSLLDDKGRPLFYRVQENMNDQARLGLFMEFTNDMETTQAWQEFDSPAFESEPASLRYKTADRLLSYINGYLKRLNLNPENIGKDTAEYLEYQAKVERLKAARATAEAEMKP